MIDEKIRLGNSIKEKALELGFDRCGFASVGLLTDEIANLSRWLNKGYHAEMNWMKNYTGIREDPGLLFNGARSVIVVLCNYFPKNNQPEGVPIIAKYSYGRDYHKVLKKRLTLLLSHIHTITEVEGRVCVDSAPVMEKVWAQRAGLGWIGKNGCLINRELGSFFVIGEIFVNIELTADKPEKDRCGNCSACISACPTCAIVQPKVVDANRCISYLTIEHKGDFPKDAPNNLKNRVFGCDICQDVCPWNKKSKPTAISDFMPYIPAQTANLDWWKNLTPEQFTDSFSGTPVMRTGFQGLKRNLDLIFNDTL